MTEISAEMRKEIDVNFEAMEQKLDEYMPFYADMYALMRHGEVIEFYLRWEDAYRTGMKFLDDRLFSIQQVTKTPIDLGFFSHVVHLGQLPSRGPSADSGCRC